MSKNDNDDARAPRVLCCDGGGRRDRTDDLLLAKQALSQLSYGPKSVVPASANASAGNLPLHSQAKVGGPGKI